MSDLNEELPGGGTQPENGDGNVQVPDSTGTEQVPDTTFQPQPAPEPGQQDKGEPLPPEPLIGPVGF